MKLQFSALALLFAASAHAAYSNQPTVVLVDKEANRLHLAKYTEDQYEILETHRTTVGRVKGDKEVEGDLKTPEGVYFFTANLRPPSIKPKFGVLALYMNYPNQFDRLAGRSGFDIMLHATDNPERLKKDLDSEGCVVLRNEELEELSKKVRIQLTPILVFEDLNNYYLLPGGDQKLKSFFGDWIKAWQTKDIDTYIDSYHSAFESGGRTLAQYRAFKQSLNQNYKRIEIEPENIQYFRHPKYSVIMFKQNYRSYTHSGQMAHNSMGTKKLMVAQEDGELKIIEEDFTQEYW